jgi:UDP-N-acetylglucosamine--N-acetylmuramyl-(pentapeptide) pyrophosphoryl-undecaprenol N-acetylglucosamine transferase
MTIAQDRPIRIIIAGGGTGGHVLPAIAVIEELRQREIAFDPLWIGSSGGVEREAAARAGIAFRAVPVGKFRRDKDIRNAADCLRVPVGVARSWAIVRAFHPDVIFSTGGFVSVPTVVAGFRRAPVLTHEQTAVLGLATRINLRFAHELAVSWEQTANLSRRRPSIVTGNPIRASLFGGDRLRGFEHFGFDPNLPLVYVTGGARGARSVNERVIALLPDLLEHCQIIHQTGPATMNDNAATLRSMQMTWPDRLQRRYHVTEFLADELRDVYAAADLVVGRAGAGTVAELAALGKPAILIPLPNTGGREQDVNAALMGAAGAALVLNQNDATPDRLKSEILALLNNRDRLVSMSSSATTLGRIDAASKLVDELLRLGRSSSRN